MKCPSCGAAELIHDTRGLPYTYKGEASVIPAVTGDFCPACGELVLDREHGDRYGELMGLFQRQAAELFGGGVNAFSRYENGKTKPPLALVKLLKLLDRHPDLLNEIRTA
jgi:HTH-type transcriptional regulator / antitoxin MqsA